MPVLEKYVPCDSVLTNANTHQYFIETNAWYVRTGWGKAFSPQGNLTLVPCCPYAHGPRPGPRFSTPLTRVLNSPAWPDPRLAGLSTKVSQSRHFRAMQQGQYHGPRLHLRTPASPGSPPTPAASSKWPLEHVLPGLLFYTKVITSGCVQHNHQGVSDIGSRVGGATGHKQVCTWVACSVSCPAAHTPRALTLL